MLDAVVDALEAIAERPPANAPIRVAVALSGGRDSIALRLIAFRIAS